MHGFKLLSLLAAVVGLSSPTLAQPAVASQSLGLVQIANSSASLMDLPVCSRGQTSGCRRHDGKVWIAVGVAGVVGLVALVASSGGKTASP